MSCWIEIFISAACFAGDIQLKEVLSCCLALALLMGGVILKHGERTHRGGTSQNPLSSWGAMPTLRVPATQAVGDGRDRSASILIPGMCCIFRWMLLGSRVGLGIVICPLLRSAFSSACLFLFSDVFTGHLALGRRASDVAWLGNSTGHSTLPVAEVLVPCMGTHLDVLAMFLAVLG